MRKRLFLFLVMLGSLCFGSSVFAWSNMGHEVVAQIAYDNLDSTAKERINNYTNDFVLDSIWPDKIKQQDITIFNHWHYINYPVKQAFPHRVGYNQANIVSVLYKLDNILQSPRSTDEQKAYFLKFYSHLVGDIHQPLHTADLYSKLFPKGDQGGNLYRIKPNSNLHRFWDGGLGLFSEYKNPKALAKKIETDYPKNYFSENALSGKNYTAWAKESHAIAKNQVYQIKLNTRPNYQYIETGQAITEKQLALAGYRLASKLNQFYGTTTAKKGNKKLMKKTAIFAGGCFWCMQPPFDKQPGVISTRVGYTGGHIKNPSYEDVTAGNSGHYEAIEVTYDPNQVSYETLLTLFWHNIDPTQGDGQFCDRGESYKSVIFYQNEHEKQLAEASKSHIMQQDKISPVMTKILPASIFYPAEGYHQDYYKKNPIRYKFYRKRCGRDARLRKIWGDKATIVGNE